MSHWMLVAVVLALALGCANGAAYRAAGVLPYARHKGELKLLLGCEPRDDRGDAHLWTDFTGGRRGMDASVLETAAREFSEESRGAYRIPEVRERLAQADARVTIGGEVEIFLAEVRWIPAYAIEQRPTRIDAEKHRYCWVEVRDLLGRIDAAGADLARVPDHCGPEPRTLYDVFQANLVEGAPLRSQLDSLLVR